MPANVVPREFTGDASGLQSKSERIVRALADKGVTHVVGVPDNATRIIFDLLESSRQIQVVSVCREGEAWAIASGIWVGGKCPVVMIQNTGFLESGDAFRGTASEMGIPMLVFMDYRGFHTLENADEDSVDSAARLFEPTLKAWGLPYHFLDDATESDTIGKAIDSARRRQCPVAVLMT